MAADVMKKIVGLLGDASSPEKQIAAAVVLGEIGARDAGVVEGLCAMLDSGLTPLQRAAASALERLGSNKALPKLLPLLASRDEGVRSAATAAVIAFGDAAVPALKGRLATADHAEKRALEEALGKLGGRDALAALLGALLGDDVESAKAATLAVRQRVKDADARTRRGYLSQVESFLNLKKTKASSPATAAALKILGFLEDERAIPRLVKFATDDKQPVEVRQEAVIALRFAAAGKAGAKLVPKLIDLAEKAPLGVARAALYTLATIDLPPAAASRLGRVAVHPETERALLAIERLGAMSVPVAGAVLGRVLAQAGDRARAEAAATALAARADAAPSLVGAMLETFDDDRAQLLARLLRPHARKLEGKLGKTILQEGVERLAMGRAGAMWFIHLARDVDAAALAKSLRERVDKLRKARKLARALEVARVLGGSAEAAPQDGYALASLELGAGQRDAALQVIGQLLGRGVDVAAAMRKDRSLAPEALYQLGFDLVERNQPLGEEILADLAVSGRGKVAKMAKAKLRSSGLRD